MGNGEGFHLDCVAGVGGGTHQHWTAFFLPEVEAGVDVSMCNICVHVGATSELCNRV